ncbi:MAG: efflux RND transporter periplasmic adaptor subunit [Leptospiraceae bacterium]|nr:efflux RND transporter periplasmic adaptor subunit [Leptospiraceae bacterium]NUM41107.1 efflux RND transporter periplasmic adaptor subunit [Leptospiraceae bacterium]
MNLVLKKDSVSTTHSNESSKDTTHEPNSLYLSEDKEALIGIKTSKIEFRNLVKRVSFSGNVAYDPELYSAILEFREAVRNSKISEEDSVSSNALIQSAKIRLKQLGLSDSTIQEWTKENKNITQLIAGGKNGKSLIYSQVYESDISLIRLGQKVEVKSSSFPKEIFTGEVRGIDSIVNTKNRTLRVRSEVNDPKNLLKPQMFTEIVILVNLGKLLSAPKSAILDTGKKQVAYLKISESKFLPKIVRTGQETEEFYEILNGLKEMDEVVVGGNFLLDSEAKLKLGETSNHEQLHK